MADPIILPVNTNTERIQLRIAGGLLAIKAVSPVVTLEETEDGVLLTVTDVDGPKSALIPKGADYILTAADKDEIAQAVMEGLCLSVVDGAINITYEEDDV